MSILHSQQRTADKATDKTRLSHRRLHRILCKSFFSFGNFSPAVAAAAAVHPTWHCALAGVQFWVPFRCPCTEHSKVACLCDGCCCSSSISTWPRVGVQMLFCCCCCGVAAAVGGVLVNAAFVSA